MAATFDAFSSGVWASGLTLTISHTVAADATNLVVFAGYKFIALTNITGVTFNGVAMTHVTPDGDQGSNVQRISIWKLASPASGTHDIVITVDDNTGLSLLGIGVSATLGDAVSNATTNPQASGNPTVTVPSQTDALVLAATCTEGDPAASETAIAEVNNGAGLYLNVQRKAGETSTVMAWTESPNGDPYICSGISLSPAATGVTLLPGLGSTPITGRTMTIGWSIGMPDQA